MPYQTIFIPAARDQSLPLLPDLPSFAALRPLDFDDLTEAHGRTPDGNMHHFYSCPCCKGWIEGVPSVYPLPDKRGKEFCCIRCGERIGFAARLG